MQLELGCFSVAVVPLVRKGRRLLARWLRHAQPVVDCELDSHTAGSEMLQRAEVQ